MKQLISKSIYISITPEFNYLTDIESILKNEYGEIVRWAIVEVLPDRLKLCITFEA